MSEEKTVMSLIAIVFEDQRWSPDLKKIAEHFVELHNLDPMRMNILAGLINCAIAEGYVQGSWNLRLAWFAGILDGEGSIGLSKNTPRKPTKTNYIIAPAIQVSNANFLLVKEVKTILKQLGVKSTHSAVRRFKNAKWADEYKINVTKHADVIKILQAVQPYLISKREQAAIVLAFCCNRVGKHRCHSKGNHGQFVQTYDGSELILYEKLRPLNKKGPQRR
jgi:signal recognition particle subunit SEC65